ncbi:MAG: short-subunit dehydrogenase [Rhodothermales bacterium]|jgi:short-subunit dehydrogenase
MYHYEVRFMSKRVLVTGASRGIGRALVCELRKRDCTVFATARDGNALAELAAETGCQTHICDLSKPAVLDLYAVAQEALRGVDVLVNNAGFNNRKAAITNVSHEELDLQYAVNLRAPFLLGRDALRNMSARGSGHIVNILSTVCHTNAETMAVYSAMKQGLRSVTDIMIKEAAAHGVKVTGVYPGGTNTGFRPNERTDYMNPAHVAHVIADAIFSPDDVVMHTLTFRPLVERNF